MSRQEIRREARELILVAAGAIPGALLRWQLGNNNMLANLLGCLLLGLVLSGPKPAARLMLWAGIGLCGSLTTFSGWMLELARALDRGATLTALGVLLVNLLGGLALMSTGQALGRLWFRRPGPGSS